MPEWLKAILFMIGIAILMIAILTFGIFVVWYAEWLIKTLKGI